jgi:Tol biopolymer transport system component
MSGILRGGIFWMPDSRAFAYVQERDGVDNYWIQPIDGTSVRQITNFTADKIFLGRWSGNGKQLAIVRGKDTSDVILINDLR